MRLLANMVVKNEEPHYLHRVLARLKDQVDEIILTDDCSDDNTVSIAEFYGAKIQVMSEPTFSIHEGRLRQKSWEHFENFADEKTWCLAIDADEELYTTRLSLEELMSNSAFDVYNIDFYHMWNPTQYRIDKAWRPHGSSRMFRYKPGGVFKDRPLACGSEPTYVEADIRARRFYANTGLKMKHLSYIKDEDKRKKYERYAALDGGKYHANAHIQSIMDPAEIIRLANWEW